MDLGLVFPGLGVETSEEGVSDVGGVRLIKAERVPGRCGVVVEATVEGNFKGDMVRIEPNQDAFGLDLESMLVEPDKSRRVCIVVCNPSSEVVNLQQGQLIASAHLVSEGLGVNRTGMWVEGDVVPLMCSDVCHVGLDPEGLSKRKDIVEVWS